MLTSLMIQNVVLIDHLEIEFQSGLCTLTGETGAGKSILLESLGLALGARAEARLVRAGQDQASVSAVFEVSPDHPVLSYCRERELLIDGTELILRRTLKSDGRSKAFLNDQAVSISLLAEVGAHLVEIHGQHETQGLLDPATHRLHLDQFAGAEPAVSDLKKLWQDWRTAEKNYAAQQEKAAQARADETYLRQAVEDLEDLNPQENEEVDLTDIRTRLMNREQILEGLNTAYYALNGEHDPVQAAARALDRIAEKAGDRVNDPLAALDRATAEIQEALSLIQSFSGDLSDGEQNLAEIDDRLFALKAQARKHHCAIADLPAKCRELSDTLALIVSGEEHLALLAQQVQAAKARYMAQAQEISELRRRAAGDLDAAVAKELPPLKMERARFVTQIDPLPEPEWSENGLDRVRFLVATNPGSAPGALNKIASGGEMSRFMLALKVVMAELGSVETMIFDEVDAGIGGATADAVGERLARLGRQLQILVVTHSPQVAARGAFHWIVQKTGNDNAVTTNIVPLKTAPERREEIARMLSGAEITGEARRAAEKLLLVNDPS
ncbi:MAG: DNA repair protein RecN [Rhodospirillales bacterium]|nr:DNA repair protein RecN [Rhodospirillales bacterium]MCB9979580.1 DNA repair protein RecN [Rhodospirillales bacterium]